MKNILMIIIFITVLCFCTGCAVRDVDSESSSSRINAPLPDNIAATDTINPIDETPYIPKEVKISFLAAGDNIIHSNIFEDAYERRRDDTPEYNFFEMYEDIQEMVTSADIAFVNQETPIAGSEYGYSGYPNFNSPDEAGDALVDLGFDIVNIANNHMLDKWESGLKSTIDYWETKKIMLLGGHRNTDDYNTVRVYEEQGVKIAFLSYTYGTNGMYLPAGSEMVIPWIDNDEIKRQILSAKELGDLVFVSIHWGNEDWFQPSDAQKTTAQIMVDMGVDVIIGHHPHVVQPIKWVEGSSGHRTLLIYSLGNLISTMLYSRNMVGGIATFDIIKNGNDDPYVDNAVFTPVMCHYNMSRRGLQVYKLENYTEELASQHGAQKNGKFTYNTLIEYITSNISSEFLPDYFKQ